MFGYNLMDPMEQGGFFFKINLNDGSLKILRLLLHVFIL
jgi:hypothetical protein